MTNGRLSGRRAPHAAPSWLRRWFVLAATLVAVLAGAAATAAVARPTATRPPRLAESCVTRRDHARPVAFLTSDRVRIVGALFGNGRVGLVAGHEVRGDLCSWVPFARILSRLGFTVLTIDFRGYGTSAPGSLANSDRYDRDLLAGAAYLHSHGVSKVIYAGASMGGTAAIVAASESPTAAGVINLSGPATFLSLNAKRSIRRLTRPTYLAAGALDAGFVDDARALFAASPARTKHLDVVANSDLHGTALLGGSDGAGLRRRLIAFIRAA
jgi:pimeloyl-ACP methyl ester carboxylesterase